MVSSLVALSSFLLLVFSSCFLLIALLIVRVDVHHHHVHHPWLGVRVVVVVRVQLFMCWLCGALGFWDCFIRRDANKKSKMDTNLPNTGQLAQDSIWVD